MSVCSRFGVLCGLAATIFVASWLMANPMTGNGQGGVSAVAYNPLRSGEAPWSRDHNLSDPLPLVVERIASVPPAAPQGAKSSIGQPPLMAVLSPPSQAKTSATKAPKAKTQEAKKPEFVAAAAQPPVDLRKDAPTGIAGRFPSAPVQAKQFMPVSGQIQEKSVHVQPISLQVDPKLSESSPQPAPMPGEQPQEAPGVMPQDLPAPSDSLYAEESPTGSRPQMWLPCQSQCRCGVACPMNCGGNHHSETKWNSMRLIPWQIFAQGEYVGPARLAHVPQYHLRVDDIIRMVYGLTGEASVRPYSLAVGDIIQIESIGDPKCNRSVTIQPDGRITLRILGQVHAAGATIEELRTNLEQQYSRTIREPGISVTPVKLNTRVEELRQSVDQRYGPGGQGVFVRVTPAGTIQLPAIGSVPAQGLTLDEVKREVEARYNRRFHGVEVTPILDHRAPRYVYVLGEVKTPGRYELVAPTTAMQAIALAGSWNVGADLKRVIVFRRDECWQLMATKLHLCEALRGKRPCPSDEIWIRDSDIVLVPKSHLLETDDMIQLLFTRGLWQVVPFNLSYGWTNLTAL
jgi:polysaccharide biosynthesis/export protein